MTMDSFLAALQRRPALDGDVRRVTPEGYPTEALQDFELFEYDFTSRAVEALDAAATATANEVALARGTFGTLNGRIASISSVIGDSTSGLVQAVNQLVTEVEDANTGLIATVDDLADATVNTANGTSLASRTTTVEAVANQATASGQIRLEAVSAPAGVSARFSIELNTGTGWAPTGLYLERVGGVGRIAMVANQVTLTDPGYNGGLPGNVWAYADGKFVFNVPVRVGNADLADEAATRVRFDPGNTGSGIVSSTAATSITVRGTGSVRVHVHFEGSPQTSRGIAAGTFSAGMGQIRLRRDGVIIKVQHLNFMWDDMNSGTRGYRVLQTTLLLSESLPAGTYDYSAEIVGISTVINDPVSIEVTELAK